MAVKYKLYQNTNSESTAFGKWYARASYGADDLITTSEICRQISHATTLTPTDVKACIASFLHYINDNLRNGKKVKLDTLGQFKVGLKTKPAETAKDFKASANVKGMRVIFTPAASENSTSIDRTKGLLEGVKVVEQGYYENPKEEDETPEP